MEFLTLNEMFLARLKASGARTAYHVHRDGRWVDVSWDAMGREVEEAAAGLLSLGLERGEAVAILGDTRPEWGECDLAVLACGGRSVGIYQTSTVEQCVHILNDSESRVVFVDAPYLEKVLAAKAHCPELAHVVVWGDAARAGANGAVESYGALKQAGRELLAGNPGALHDRRGALAPDDDAIIIYTSGTTGLPKGAVLTHKNLCTMVKVMARATPLTESDLTISFLPMAHGAERVVSFYNRIATGTQTAYARSIDRLVEDIQTIRPTVFGSVPRIFEKVYARIQGEIQKAPAPRRQVAEWAFRIAQEVSRRTRRGEKKLPLALRLQYRLADRLVLAKIRDSFGGRVRFFVSGAAPISLEILEFFHACGMLVLEVYGLTEASVVVSANRPDDFRLGTVGKTLPGVQVRLAADGEILVRGDTVFKGYHRNEEATREAIDHDGWLHTGDIGEFDRDGFLRITDRKKNLIITAGGKNIAPANIEALLKREPLVGQVLAIGDRRAFVVALIALEPEAAAKFASDHGLSGDLESLASHPKLLEQLQRAVDTANRDLARFEQVKKFAVLPRELTLEGGELTPTLKVKRKVVEEKYKQVIEGLYAEAPGVSAGGA